MKIINICMMTKYYSNPTVPASVEICYKFNKLDWL